MGVVKLQTPGKNINKSLHKLMAELNSRPKEQLKEQFFKGILLRAVSHLVFQQGIKILFKHWSCRQKSVLDKWPMYMRIRFVFAFLSKNSVHCEIEKICLNEKWCHHGARDIFNNKPNTFLSLWRCSFSFILFSTECDSHMTLISWFYFLFYSHSYSHPYSNSCSHSHSYSHQPPTTTKFLPATSRKSTAFPKDAPLGCRTSHDQKPEWFWLRE